MYILYNIDNIISCIISILLSTLASISQYQYQSINRPIYIFIILYLSYLSLSLHAHPKYTFLYQFSFHFPVLGPEGEVHAASTARLGAGLWPRQRRPGAAGCLGHLPGRRWTRCSLWVPIWDPIGSGENGPQMVVNGGSGWLMVK